MCVWGVAELVCVRRKGWAGERLMVRGGLHPTPGLVGTGTAWVLPLPSPRTPGEGAKRKGKGKGKAKRQKKGEGEDEGEGEGKGEGEGEDEGEGKGEGGVVRWAVVGASEGDVDVRFIEWRVGGWVWQEQARDWEAKHRLTILPHTSKGVSQ